MEHQAKSAVEQAPVRARAEPISEPAWGSIGHRPPATSEPSLTQALDSNARIVAQRELAEAMDNSPRIVAQRKLAEALNNSSRAVAQREVAEARSTPRENNTGLPDVLKSGIESLSGVSLDGIRVHYNSSQPARVNAHAYAQGTDIHVASGQERHLPHEAWHVVQQAQGRVKPTLQMKGVAINDDLGLEREADMMGARAVDHAAQRLPGGSISAQRMSLGHGSTAAKLGPTTMQRVVYKTMAEMWADVAPDQDEKEIKTITASNSALAQVYGDVTANLDKMDFIQDGRQPEAEIAPQKSGLYRIHYGPRAELKKPYDDKTRYVGAILHEMMHITAGLQYATNVPGNLPGAPVGHVANMNLPAATGEVKKKDAEFGLTPNQFEDEKLGAEAQIAIIFANWHTLEKEADLDLENHALTKPQCGVVKERIDYAMKVSPLGHYDTVLTDILYYLQAEGAAQSRSYDYAHRMLTEANIRRTQKAGAVQEILRAPLPPPPEVLDVKQTEKKPPPIPPAPKQSFWGFLTCCFPQQVKNKT